LSSISRSARTYCGSSNSQDDIRDQQEPDNRTGHAGQEVAALVVETHERAVEAEARRDSRERLQGANERERTVVDRGEKPALHVHGEQREVDDLDGGVSRAVDGHAGRQVFQPIAQGGPISCARSAGG
jgi:hypothetical protein